jgi:lipoprotein-anchoring transpeptidase ErfK/SrfK
MRKVLSKRNLLIGMISSGLASRVSAAQDMWGDDETGHYTPELLPPPESEIDFPIEYISPRRIKKRYRPQQVQLGSSQVPGSIIVDPANRFLYHMLSDMRAMRYGVGVGRQGFEWSGHAIVGMKRRWPRWVPPIEMVDRDQNAARWANGMPGGPDNPLGARALYLYENGVDTLYRIHGTNEPTSIGKATSSGCIRMLNQDIAALYDKVAIGTLVIVLSDAAV